MSLGLRMLWTLILVLLARLFTLLGFYELPQLKQPLVSKPHRLGKWGWHNFLVGGGGRGVALWWLTSRETWGIISSPLLCFTCVEPTTPSFIEVTTLNVNILLLLSQKLVKVSFLDKSLHEHLLEGRGMLQQMPDFKSLSSIRAFLFSSSTKWRPYHDKRVNSASYSDPGFSSCFELKNSISL